MKSYVLPINKLATHKAGDICSVILVIRLALLLALFIRCVLNNTKQYIFSPLGNKICFHAKLFHCFNPPTWPP